MKKYVAVVMLIVVALVVVARTRTTPTPVTSFSFGPMALYESAKQPFSIEYPAEWTDHLKVQNGTVVVWRMSSQGEWFVIVENTSTEGESVLSEYVDRVISWDSKTDPQHEMVSREQTETVQGLPAELLEYTVMWSEGPMTVNALICNVMLPPRVHSAPRICCAAFSPRLAACTSRRGSSFSFRLQPAMYAALFSTVLVMPNSWQRNALVNSATSSSLEYTGEPNGASCLLTLIEGGSRQNGLGSGE